MKNNLLKISMLIALIMTLSVFNSKTYAQLPTILINGTPTLVDDATALPFWMSSSSTLEAGTKVNYISVLQYSVVPATSGGNDLQFDTIIIVSTQQTVPPNKAWKVEAVAKDITAGTAGVTGATGPTGPTGLIGPTGPAGQLPSATNGQTLRFNGTDWIANSEIFNDSSNIGIGTSSPETSAMLDISSNDKGILIPRVSLLSTTDIVTVNNPVVSLLVYNTNSAIVGGSGVGFYYWDGTSWMQMGSGGASACPGIELPKAGGTINAINGSTVNLAGNTPVNATGTWSILSGTGGNITNLNTPNSTFTGNGNETYELQWTFSLSGCPDISDFGKVIFGTANYTSGNEAYWNEKSNGFRDVTIGTNPTIFVYDASNKMYKNQAGTLILLPTISRQGSVQPETVSATNFYGYLGGSANNNNFQWDGLATLPGNTYDVHNVFVSPISPTLNYCQMLQNNYSGSCNSSSSNITYATTTFAYSTTPNGLGPYSVYNGNDLTPTNSTGSFGNRRYSQQSMVGDGFNDSYCVATYGKGWRIPTDIEVGRPNNLNDNGTPPLNPGYVGTTNEQM
jgi:hypothetical protein